MLRREYVPGVGTLPTFGHGVHPPEHKHATEGKPIERMPFVDEYVLPLSQHIGAPSKAIVAAGERVLRGQRIADPAGFISTALHAPVTGTVKEIGLRLHPNGSMAPAIVIQTDPYSSQRVTGAADPVDLAARPPGGLVKHVQLSGLVGLGGAAFPSHVKLSVPDGKKVEYVVINGCECEPYLTCDHRMMLEMPEAIIRGIEIIMQQVGAPKAVIGVESNKVDAVETLSAAAPASIEVKALVTKYPQGAEKMLIDSIFGKKVPPKVAMDRGSRPGLPMDVGMLVNNVGTVAGLTDWLDHGVPLIERVVTVTGPGIAEPKNLMIPLGTPLSAVLEHCGGLLPSVKQVVLGGPMMGAAQKSLDVPMLKGASGVLCLDDVEVATRQEYPCIRCGRCIDACPMYLNPARLIRIAKSLSKEARDDWYDLLEGSHVWSCFECASCSFVCPSGIPLVHWMRLGKAMLRNRKTAA